LLQDQIIAYVNIYDKTYGKSMQQAFSLPKVMVTVAEHPIGDCRASETDKENQGK